jgi:hypothetical protein
MLKLLRGHTRKAGGPAVGPRQSGVAPEYAFAESAANQQQGFS